ncbi:MAG: UDP-N-acetylmuramate--L-alanine ligase, partial [Patescibacteria group bacterium]
NNNVEMQEARRRNLLIMSYPEILSELFNERYGLAVCGTHGKTTTAALLAFALERCGVSPGAVIGSQVKDWGGNALLGKGEYFVIEADEYQNKLALYKPKGVILTSVDFDHPDFFPDFYAYKKAFSDFVAKIPRSGFLVVWGDSVDTLEVAKNSGGEALTYGFGEENSFRISNFKFQISKQDQISNAQISRPMQEFAVFYEDTSLGEFQIQLVGKHNVLNATAVVATCYKLGMDMEKVREALGRFRGTSRRFEYIGERNGAILIDDYGHHPEEIRATLKGAREIYPEKNIWAIFHPHSFSRTEALLSEFSQSFDDADKVIILDIYGSARETSGKVSSEDLTVLINKYSHGKAEYIPTIPEAIEFLKDKIGPEDLVISIGAGNVFEVVHKLKEKHA